MVMCCSIMTYDVSSEEYSTLSSLDYYQKKLELFNEKHKTSLYIDVNNKSEAELNNMLIFYSAMTSEEFEEYFLGLQNLYETWFKSNGDTEITVTCEELNNGVINPNDITRSSPTVSELQYCFYNVSSNLNSFYIIGSVNYSGGWGVYSNITNAGYFIDKYPAYIADHWVAKLHNSYGKSTADVLYTCKVYLTTDIYVDSTRNIPITYTAGGGDIYQYIST